MQETKRHGFDPWVGKMPWRRKWQSTLVVLPGDSHRQRSLAGYCPKGRQESDTTEQLRTARHLLYTQCKQSGSPLFQLTWPAVLTTPAFHLSLLSSCHHLLRVSVLTLPPPLPPFPPALLSSLEAAVRHYYYFLAYTLPFLAPSSPHGVMQQTLKKKKTKSESQSVMSDSL